MRRVYYLILHLGIVAVVEGVDLFVGRRAIAPAPKATDMMIMTVVLGIMLNDPILNAWWADILGRFYLFRSHESQMNLGGLRGTKARCQAEEGPTAAVGPANREANAVNTWIILFG